MFGKKGNKTLGILFAVLLVVAVLLYFTDIGKKERTFKDVLVDIDTASVTQILIYPKSQNHQEIKVYKENNEWKLPLPNGKIARVPTEKVTNLFTQLLSIKPKRLAGRGISKWGEFQVDSTGTEVKVIEDGATTLDIILGKMSFQQPRTVNTFVRLAKDNDVYEVDGFLDMTFNQDSKVLRDGTIINSDYNTWQTISFSYPADTSFQISHVDNKWLLNGMKADSVKTVNSLRALSKLSNTDFIDDIGEDDLLLSPTYKLTIETQTSQTIEVEAFVDSARTIIKTSQNPDTYFDGKNILKRIFLSQKKFM